VLGRNFVDGEDQVGREHVAVINNAFWASQFGSDPKILGRTMVLDRGALHDRGRPSPGRTDLTATKIWRPLAFPPGNMTRDFHWFGAWARLKHGVTLKQARTQMDALAIRIAHDYPKSNKGWGIGLDTFSEVTVNPFSGHPFLSLWGGGDGAADRVREPCQPDAGARHCTPAGGRHPGPHSGRAEGASCASS